MQLEKNIAYKNEMKITKKCNSCISTSIFVSVHNLLIINTVLSTFTKGRENH